MTIAIALALNAAVFFTLSYVTSKIVATATYKRDVKRNLLIARCAHRPVDDAMKISLNITLNLDRERPTPEPEPEPQPSGCDAMVEHANHDSTPRMLGFTPNPLTYEE